MHQIVYCQESVYTNAHPSDRHLHSQDNRSDGCAGFDKPGPQGCQSSCQEDAHERC
jgi:hypothetical protein